MTTLKFFQILALLLLQSVNASAAGGSHFGFNAGFGLPYTTQLGINYVASSGMFGVDLSYNMISLSSGLATASLTKPEVMPKWYPFGGALFIGVGIGQQTLSASATDAATGATAKVEVTSMTLTPTLGWLWGKSDGGIIFGFDFGLQQPSGAKTTITSSLPTTNRAYLDAVDQGNTLGNTSFPVFTLLRLGYLF